MFDYILAILRGNTAWYMTTSDLAFWIYGFDDEDDRKAVRELIMRLRKDGHIIETRPIPWSELGRLTMHGYRLIEQVARVGLVA